MSSGFFVTRRYQDTKDPGNYRAIQIQPETEALIIDGVTNAEPAGALNSYPSAQVSKGKRSIGVNARTVSISFVGTPPTGYQAGGVITLPWLAATTFGAIDRGMEGTYLSTDIKVVGTSPEFVR